VAPRAGIDVIYALSGPISSVYLADAAADIEPAVRWAFARDKAE
jgi:hypothetical protein